jgi:hypothetical protein
MVVVLGSRFSWFVKLARTGGSKDDIPKWFGILMFFSKLTITLVTQVTAGICVGMVPEDKDAMR